jgi:hypothetical protein
MRISIVKPPIFGGGLSVWHLFFWVNNNENHFVKSEI